jgi:hypothetical protein
MQNDKQKLSDVDSPVNVEERYLYAMVTRLDALCHMVSSLVEHIASKEGIAVQENKVVEKPLSSKRKKTKEV